MPLLVEDGLRRGRVVCDYVADLSGRVVVHGIVVLVVDGLDDGHIANGGALLAYIGRVAGGLPFVSGDRAFIASVDGYSLASLGRHLILEMGGLVRLGIGRLPFVDVGMLLYIGASMPLLAGVDRACLTVGRRFFAGTGRLKLLVVGGCVLLRSGLVGSLAALCRDLLVVGGCVLLSSRLVGSLATLCRDLVIATACLFLFFDMLIDPPHLFIIVMLLLALLPLLS